MTALLLIPLAFVGIFTASVMSDSFKDTAGGFIDWISSLFSGDKEASEQAGQSVVREKFNSAVDTFKEKSKELTQDAKTAVFGEEQVADARVETPEISTAGAITSGALLTTGVAVTPRMTKTAYKEVVEVGKGASKKVIDVLDNTANKGANIKENIANRVKVAQEALNGTLPDMPNTANAANAVADAATDAAKVADNVADTAKSAANTADNVVDAAKAAGKAVPIGRFAKVARVLGPVGTAAAVTVDVVDVGSHVAKGDYREASASAASLAGNAGSCAAGAGVGVLVAPYIAPVSGAIGCGVGTLINYFTMDETNQHIGRKIYDGVVGEDTVLPPLPTPNKSDGVQQVVKAQ